MPFPPILRVWLSRTEAQKLGVSIGSRKESGSMPLFVNFDDWYALSETARNAITGMLHEIGLLDAGEDIHIDLDQPSLRSDSPPSLLDPETANALRQAVDAGLEAVTIVSCTHLTEDGKESCFVVAYTCRDPP